MEFFGVGEARGLQVQTFTYCAAAAVVRTLGRKKMPCCNTIRSHIRDDPPWEFRLQNEVSKLSCKLGRFTQYRRGNTARKLTRKVEDILRPRKVHAKKNWKAPGPNMVHNFWYIHLKCVHPVMGKSMQNIINNPKLAPFLCQKKSRIRF